MPLKRKMVCPPCVAGAGGTIQVVRKEEIGFPALLLQPAYVIQPLARAGLGGDGRTETFNGIKGCNPAFGSIRPRSATTLPAALTFLARASSIRSEWPAS